MTPRMVEIYEARLAEFLTALRSEDYQQATGQLRAPDDGYCCLGLACEISGISEWESQDSRDTPYLYLGNDQVLPPEVQTYYGFNDPKGTYLVRGTLSERSLMNFNDNGVSFKEIANVIEQNQSELFHWAQTSGQ